MSEELSSVFREYVKFTTAYNNALLSILRDNGTLSDHDMVQLNRRQSAILAKLDQLEAAAGDRIRQIHLGEVMKDMLEEDEQPDV
jgi:hypothetical protein